MIGLLIFYKYTCVWNCKAVIRFVLIVDNKIIVLTSIITTTNTMLVGALALGKHWCWHFNLENWKKLIFHVPNIIEKKKLHTLVWIALIFQCILYFAKELYIIYAGEGGRGNHQRCVKCYNPCCMSMLVALVISFMCMK